MGTCSTKSPMGRTNTERGFKTQNSLKARRVLRKSNSLTEIKFRMSDFVSQNTESLQKVYRFMHPPLGKGSFGEVRKCVNLKTNEVRAIKSICLTDVNNSSRRKIINEINILRSLDHPNIVKIYEFFDTQKYMYIVMEHLTAEPLFDYLIKHKPTITEKEVAVIMHQLLSAVYFMHRNGIVHRDIKSENCLYNGSILSIIDFGASKAMANAKIMKNTKGTAFYMAPEVIKGHYTEKCDIWSCGIILYILLSGSPPFEAASQEETFQKILNLQFDKPIAQITGVSKEAKNLLTRMLAENPENRISAEDALAHPFFDVRKKDFNPESLSHVAKNLEKFIFKNKLQEAVFMYFMNAVVTQSEQTQIIETFKAMDANNDGVLTKEELKFGMHKAGKIYCDEEIDEMFAKIDQDGNGTISFSEYMAAAIDKDTLLSEERIIRVFKIFDKDKSGKISMEEFREIFEKNESLLGCDWMEMVKEVDSNGDGEVG